MENEISGLDQSNEETVDFDNLDVAEEQEDPAVLKANIAKLNEQKKRWRDRALDPSGKTYKELYETALKPKQETPIPVEPDVKDRLYKIEQIEEKRQFGYQNNLSPEETDYLFALAKGSEKKPSELLADTFVKGGLETVRKQKNNESATPRPSSRSPMVEGKSFNELKPEDKRKHWAKVTGAEK